MELQPSVGLPSITYIVDIRFDPHVRVVTADLTG